MNHDVYINTHCIKNKKLNTGKGSFLEKSLNGNVINVRVTSSGFFIKV